MKTFNKIALALAAAFAVSALLPAGYAAAAEKMAAVVVFVEGDAKLIRSGSPEPVELKLNEALQEGDAVKTGPGAKASLVTKGGAEIRINENSDFSIPVKKRNFFNLGGGQVWSRMLSKMAKLNVRTPSAVCAVRGTEADIEQKEILTVKVYEGHVDLTGNQGRTQSLRAGQISTVAGANAAPAAPRQMTAGEQGKWQDGIDVKDIGKYLSQMGLEPADKKVRMKINKDGQAKDVEIKLKKK